MNFLQPAAARLPARATFRKEQQTGRERKLCDPADPSWLDAGASKPVQPRDFELSAQGNHGCGARILSRLQVDVQPGAFVELERLTSTNTRQPKRVHSLLSAPSPSASFLRPHTSRIAPAYIHTFDGFAAPLRPASLLIASQLPTAFSGVRPDPVSHTLGHSPGAST